MPNKSRYESVLVSGGAGDGNVYMTDVNKKRLIRDFSGHQGAIYSLFSWNGDNFASAGEDGTIRVWDARQINPIYIDRKSVV